MLTLTSCVIHRDINEINFVLGAAFDYNPSTKQYQVNVQVPKTQAFAKGEGTKSSEENYMIYQGKGKTPFLAIRDMTKIGRPFFWGHCDNYIIGNGLARHGIYDTIDFLVRDSEIRAEAHLMVTNTPLPELLTKAKGIQTVPMMSLSSILEESLSVSGKGINTIIDDVNKGLLNENNSYLATLLSESKLDYPAKESTYKFDVSGAAVLKGDKMIAVLSPAEVRGYNFITNEIENTLINTIFRGADLVVENLNSRASISIYTENNEVALLVEVEPQGSIAQVGKQLDFQNPAVMKEIEKKYAAAIKHEIENTIERAQILQADFFGFGREIEIADSQLWAKIKDRWQQEIFPETEITVTVKPTILRTGLIITTQPGDEYEKH
jgi:spore germination protein KC